MGPKEKNDNTSFILVVESLLSILHGNGLRKILPFHVFLFFAFRPSPRCVCYGFVLLLPRLRSVTRPVRRFISRNPQDCRQRRARPTDWSLEKEKNTTGERGMMRDCEPARRGPGSRRRDGRVGLGPVSAGCCACCLDLDEWVCAL